jgi:hypothetical protein
MATESHEFDRSLWTTYGNKKHLCLNFEVKTVHCLHEMLFLTISRPAILLQTAAKMHSFLETLIAEARDILHLWETARGIIPSDVEQGVVLSIEYIYFGGSHSHKLVYSY